MENIAKFEAILDLEFDAKTTRAAMLYKDESKVNDQLALRLADTRKREADDALRALYEAVSELSDQEMKAFMEYKIAKRENS